MRRNLIPSRNFSADAGLPIHHRPNRQNNNAPTMKTALTLVTLALVGIASAQDAKPEGKRPHMKHRVPPAVLEQFDANGDGKLDESEHKTAREAMREKHQAMREKMLEAFDADGDGKLDESERKAMHEARMAKHEALLAQYDADGDGKLNREEIEAARAAGEELPPHPRGFMGPKGPRGPRGEGGKRQGPPAGE